MMKRRAIILLVLLLGSFAMAQTPKPAAKTPAPVVQPVGQAKPVPVQSPKPQPAPAQAARPASAPHHPAPVTGGHTVAVKHPPAANASVAHSGGTHDEIEKAIRHTAGKKKGRAAGTTAAKGPAPAGGFTAERDPFVSRIVERTRNGGAPCMGTGRQCLTVGDVSLHGVVVSQGHMLAVVVNGDHTYFLREHDPLADGEVVRINRDSIVMHERLTDEVGRPFTREVTKKIGAPAV